MKVYNMPLYYEIAFSFVDAKRQTKLFDKFIKKFSDIEAERILDIGCGPSPQLREMTKKGYKAIGLDISREMLEYLRERSGGTVETVRADMRRFNLRRKVDFAFILMGTFKFRTNQEVLSHLDSVARSLRKGGLYLIENMDLEWPRFGSQEWKTQRDGIRTESVYTTRPGNSLKQEYKEELKIKVNDNGKRILLTERRDVKFLYPQEFLALLDLNKRFEFIGWFERNNTRRLKNGKNDNIVLLRRK